MCILQPLEWRHLFMSTYGIKSTWLVWFKVLCILPLGGRWCCSCCSERGVIIVHGLIGPTWFLLFLLMLLHDFLHLLLQLRGDDELIIWVRLGWSREITPRLLRGSISSHFDKVVTLFLTCHWPINPPFAWQFSSIPAYCSDSLPWLLPLQSILTLSKANVNAFLQRLWGARRWRRWGKS